MKADDFKAEFEKICKENWDKALAETPEIIEDCSFDEFKDEVRLELEVLLDLGIIKEKIEP